MTKWMYCDTLPLPRSVLVVLRRGGLAMQKDEDFFRQLLLELEDSDDWLHFIAAEEDDPESERRYYHALLLADAGALAVTGKDLEYFRIRDQGYALIAVMRNETAWGKVRSAAIAAGGFGAKALMTAAEAYVQQRVAAAIATVMG